MHSFFKLTRRYDDLRYVAKTLSQLFLKTKYGEDILFEN